MQRKVSGAAQVGLVSMRPSLQHGSDRSNLLGAVRPESGLVTED